jgi:hypothetical protein
MITETYSKLVTELLSECQVFYGERLISLCLFGSVARASMNYCSDIDFLLVAEPLPDGRMARVREFEAVEQKLRGLIKEARGQGIFMEFSPFFKRPFEVQQGSLLFLDMLVDGQILFDRDAFLKTYFVDWRKKLDRLGARRVSRGDTWYWILKEPYTIGEVFEI